MEQNQNGQLILPFPQLYFEGAYYLSYQDFIELSGLPKTSLYRIIKVIPDVPKINVKNRLFFRVDFCLRYHRWAKEKKADPNQ